MAKSEGGKDTADTVGRFWRTHGVIGVAAPLATILAAMIGAAALLYHNQSGPHNPTTGVSIDKQQVQSTTRPTPPQTASPTPTPTDSALTADWSGGLAGWTGGPEWKAVSSMLVSDGTGNGNDTILAPVQPAGVNYAIEAQIRLQQRPVALGTCYLGLVGRATDDHNGYYVGLHNNSGNFALVISRQSPGFPEVKSQNDDPGLDFHLYRVEFSGNQILVKIDGNLVMQASDNQYLDPGKVGLFSYGCPVEVSSFKLLPLAG